VQLPLVRLGWSAITAGYADRLSLEPDALPDVVGLLGQRAAASTVHSRARFFNCLHAECQCG